MDKIKYDAYIERGGGVWRQMSWVIENWEGAFEILASIVCRLHFKILIIVFSMESI